MDFENNLRKDIVLDNGDRETVTVNPNSYSGKFITINKWYLEHGNLAKNFKLCMWDDFSFKACPNMIEESEMEFNIDKSDPLYLPFNKMLKYKNPIIIEDDEESKDMKRYIEFKKEEDIIKIKFVNELEKDEYYPEYKFYVFVKNTGADPRSKNTDNNIKYNLVEFFKEVEDLFINDYYQMDTEDYLELKNNPKR